MEKATGVQLSQVWSKIKLIDKIKLRLNLSNLQSSWLSLKFTEYGALYYSRDLKNPQGNVLYTTSNGASVSDERFAIGPAIGRDWFDEGRGKLLLDRGPCTCRCFLSDLKS